MDAESTGRVAFFDNVKGLLIILVVVAHIMLPIHDENPGFSIVFDVIYLFHMPLFIFMSGLLAKGACRDGKLKVDKVISFFLLALIYQVALILIKGSRLSTLETLRFSSAPWYLVSMGWWYALTPLLARTRWPVALSVSALVSIGWGFVDLSSGFLAISRTLSFLPWFVLGYYCPLKTVLRARRWRGGWVVVALAAVIVIARVIDPDAYRPFFYLVYGDNPYRGGVREILDRITATAIAAILSYAALKLVPERRARITALGARTLPIYVYHRLIRAVLSFHTDFYHLPLLLNPLAGTVIILVVSAAAIAISTIPALGRPLNALMRTPWTALPRRLVAHTRT